MWVFSHNQYNENSALLCQLCVCCVLQSMWVCVKEYMYAVNYMIMNEFDWNICKLHVSLSDYRVRHDSPPFCYED